MNSYELFKQELDHALTLANSDRIVRVEVCGIDARNIRLESESMAIHGTDQNGIECILVCPISFFSAKMKILPKKKGVIGFQAKDVKGK